MKIGSRKFSNIINQLRDTASKSLYLQRHACAVIYGGKVLILRENKFTNTTLHSEILAIRDGEKIGIKWNRAILIVIRINNMGQIKNSEPCKECVEKIKQHNIKRVIYSSGYDEYIITNAENLHNDHSTYFYRKTKI